MPYKTGNAAHDAVLVSTELTYQLVLATPGLTQAQIHAADIARLTAIVNSGVANGIATPNALVALHSLQSTQNA
jgi:hypothetical protein